MTYMGEGGHRGGRDRKVGISILILSKLSSLSSVKDLQVLHHSLSIADLNHLAQPSYFQLRKKTEGDDVKLAR